MLESHLGVFENSCAPKLPLKFEENYDKPLG